MHLDHQPDVGSDRLAHRGDDRDRTPPVARRQPDAGRPERVELHRPVPACDDAPCQLGDPCRLVVGLVPAVGIGRDPVAEAAAEQPPDRNAEVLSDEVEGGDVEGSERGLAPLARTPVLEAFDRPGQPLGVERVSPDHVAAGQLLHGRHERVGLVDRPDLADPDQAGVGLEFDEDEVAPRCPDDRGSDIRDLHATSSAGAGATGRRAGSGYQGARHLECRHEHLDHRHRALDPARRRRAQGDRLGPFRGRHRRPRPPSRAARPGPAGARR